MSQIGMFDGTNKFKIDKPIRLIELFAGIGAQAKSIQTVNYTSKPAIVLL